MLSAAHSPGDLGRRPCSVSERMAVGGRRLWRVPVLSDCTTEYTMLGYELTLNALALEIHGQKECRK